MNRRRQTAKEAEREAQFQAGLGLEHEHQCRHCGAVYACKVQGCDSDYDVAACPKPECAFRGF